MVAAIREEITLRRDYLPADTLIETIYFGGGTPSLLSETELAAILSTIEQHFQVAPDAEITLEANPDDLDVAKLNVLKASPVNRLSIGIQSFFEEDLRWMNRAHSAREARMVLKNALQAGFTNLTADLIYGYPLLTDEKWQQNLDFLLSSGISHFSAYGMTVEQGTPLAGFIRKQQQKPMDEAQSARQFSFLMDTVAHAGWEQYEISNFAKDGCYSRHNTAYWKGLPYLGIGPSAHSYNGHSRQWNTRVNNRYIQCIAKGQPDFDQEMLTLQNQWNEYVMTALRTRWGISLEKTKRQFGAHYAAQLLQKCRPFLQKSQLILDDGHLSLSRQGRLFADYIAGELFV